MEEKTALIFDVQGYSVHDGPGCRTVFFFNGCPLQCVWCSNPESWSRKPHIMYLASKCRHKDHGCERCVRACKKNAATLKEGDEAISLDWDICNRCDTFECTRVCYGEALRVSGKQYTLAEAKRIIERDRQCWGARGGVTFSGGEAMLQSDFLIELLKDCKERCIHTAIETTACIATETFLNVMRYIDFAFIDVKHMDEEKHREGTGVSNKLLLSNIRALVESKWPGRLVLRIPVIPGFNDSVENMSRTADFMDSLDLFEINLLPFHRLGTSKWTQIGKEYAFSEMLPPSQEKMEELANVFLDRNIACYIGSDTAF